MGVDCNIVLDHRVKIFDLKRAIGLILGLKPKITKKDGYEFITVLGITVQSSGAVHCFEDDLLAGCYNINVSGLDKSLYGDDYSERFFMYHTEHQYNNDMHHLLSPRSTCINLALGEKLVKIFGGDLISKDSDDKVDYSEQIAWYVLKFDFYGMQDALRSIEPINKNDLERWEPYAAYQILKDLPEPRSYAWNFIQ